MVGRGEGGGVNELVGALVATSGGSVGTPSRSFALGDADVHESRLRLTSTIARRRLFILRVLPHNQRELRVQRRFGECADRRGGHALIVRVISSILLRACSLGRKWRTACTQVEDHLHDHFRHADQAGLGRYPYRR